MSGLMQNLLSETVFECTRDDQPIKRARIMHENGDVYQGEVHYIFQKPHGAGTLKTSKVQQSGLFRNGIFLCGSSSYTNGVEHNGSWEKGKKSGEGTLRCANGDYYQGYFINNLYEGEGRLIYRTGSVYQGKFKKGLREGKGVYQCFIGDVKGLCYQGQWKEDCFHGEGVLKYHNGDVYEGSFVKNRKEGKGCQKMTNGDVYEGGFLNNLYHGHGTLVLMSGSFVYEGEFRQGKFHGEGAISYQQGKIEGTFQDDKLVRQRKQIEPGEAESPLDTDPHMNGANGAHRPYDDGKTELKLSIISDEGVVVSTSRLKDD